MDLARLEVEYMAHVAGMPAPSNVALPPSLASETSPDGLAISVWKEADSCAHVDLRGLFDLTETAQLSVGSPVRSKVGLNITAPEDAPATVGVSSPIVKAAAGPDGFKKFAAPDVGFVEWAPSH